MLILGIDPGIARTGWGLIEHEAGATRLVDCGCVETRPGSDGPRLLRLAAELRAILERSAPAEAAVERLFFGNNARSALQVGQARGAALLVLVEAGVEVHEYTPVQVKEALTGFGGAGKPQVEQMVRARLGLTAPIRPDDTADALAVALCHAQGRGLRLAQRRAG